MKTSHCVKISSEEPKTVLSSALLVIFVLSDKELETSWFTIIYIGVCEFSFLYSPKVLADQN